MADTARVSNLRAKIDKIGRDIEKAPSIPFRSKIMPEETDALYTALHAADRELVALKEAQKVAKRAARRSRGGFWKTIDAACAKAKAERLTGR